MSIVFVPFYPSDWLAGTAALSDVEKGVYITLIARMYKMAGPIERDDDRLFRVCGSKSKASFVKVLNYLISEGKIIETEEGLINRKAAKVIEQTTGKSMKAKAAAQARWKGKSNKNNMGSDANAFPKHMPEPCHPEPKPEPKKGPPLPKYDQYGQVIDHYDDMQLPIRQLVPPEPIGEGTAPKEKIA